MKTCPAVECGKPIADTSTCCIRHWKMLPRGVRRLARQGADVGDIADRIWREQFYGLPTQRW